MASWKSGPYIGQYVEATLAGTNRVGTVIGIFLGQVQFQGANYVLVVPENGLLVETCHHVIGLYADDDLNEAQLTQLYTWRRVNHWWSEMRETIEDADGT